ncbi:flagellin [Candidatus Aerophobetes bacterium]|nr:flagellin [Candidatus Aerophobetes bacterium]
MRIAHNITALNAWRQLNLVNDQLGKSVERISSGYRINRAGDDPAGLVISENLRAQIVGMDQALKNTQDGISMIQTAEGALTEIHSLLDSMRSLALHAANTAATTPEAIAADQEQLDSAIESIERIATTTAFAGKNLLDGTAGKQAEIKNANYVTDVDVGDASAEGIVYVTVNISGAATRAQLGSGEVSYASQGVSLASAGVLASAGATSTLNINGVDITVSGGMTVSAVIRKINSELIANDVAISAVWVPAASGATSGYIVLRHQNYGSDYLIDLYDEKNLIVSGDITQHARGTDVVGSFTYERIDLSGGSAYTYTVSATGDGLTLVGVEDSALANLRITIASGQNSTGTLTAAVRLYNEALTFQIGAEEGQVYRVSLGDVRPSNLGASIASGGLENLKSGNRYDLATDPQTAIKIIDQAIADVSDERAKLGAIQSNILESNYRNLGITRENLQASESRIRDVDMAREMMEFTKNQILTQAATAMLAQANTLPQTVLTLLR